MFYCEEMSDKLRECGNCLDFIAQGPEDLLAKVKLMDEKMEFIPPHLGNCDVHICPLALKYLTNEYSFIRLQC
jgi:hypothetical protein